MVKVILIVIDSLGIGAMEDVYIYRKNDIGSNTLKSLINKSTNLNIPNLCKMGIINALGQEIKTFKFRDVATYGRAKLGYKGADSYLGHMEMFGYDLSSIELKAIRESIGDIIERLKLLGYNVQVRNRGLKYIVINECVFIGDNIEAESGSVYSVIGCNDRIKFNEIKQIAEEVRKIVKVPRVVAVSSNMTIDELEKYIEIEDNYIGINSEKCSLYNREYEVEHIPYKLDDSNTLTEFLYDNSISTTLIGKVADMIPSDNFNKIKLLNNEDIFNEIKKVITLNSNGFIAVNFQECDLSGHLNSVDEYVKKLNEIDKYIGWILSNVQENDMVIVTADHGNDPTIGHRYHTREKVPILIRNSEGHNGFIGEFKDLSIISDIIKIGLNNDV